MVATFWANINILAPWVKPGNDVRDLVSTREFKSVDLANITHDLKERGIILKCTEQAVDTSDASGTMFMNMLMVRGIRDQHPQGKTARRYRESQGGRRLQG
jgi:DNA invertase Pin-like site-specific DNA recombinase